MKNKITMFLLVCFIVASHLQRDYNYDFKAVLTKTFRSSVAAMSKSSIFTAEYYSFLINLSK